MLEEMKPVLAVVAGPNGSGKTTITEALLKHKWLQGCKYINPDNIAKELGDWNDVANTLEAANIAESMREKLLEKGESIAFETVFSTPNKLEFVRRARAAGYFIRFFFVSTNSPAINASRITDRYLQGGHAVPIPKIVSRYYKSIQQCVDVLPYVDRLDVFDNSAEGETKWVRLFKFGPDKAVTNFVDPNELPTWSREIYRAITEISDAPPIYAPN